MLPILAPGWEAQAAQMTAAVCAILCHSNGYSHAGTQVGNECYCGMEVFKFMCVFLFLGNVKVVVEILITLCTFWNQIIYALTPASTNSMVYQVIN